MYLQTKVRRYISINGWDIATSGFTIRYDSGYLTCSKKLTGSQLSLPHGINRKLKRETKNKMMSVISPVRSRAAVWKQTSAIMELFSRLWFRPHRTNRHVILHQNIKFNPNRSTNGGDMTSCRFLKMAAAVAQYYYVSFPNWWCHFFRNSNSVIKPNVVDIFQFMAEI